MGHRRDEFPDGRSLLRAEGPGHNGDGPPRLSRLNSGSAPEGPANSLVRVVIVADHRLSLFGLRALIQGQPGLKIVGEGAAADQALNLVARLRPDVLCLNLRWPAGVGSGVEQGLLALAAQMQARFPATRVAVLAPGGPVPAGSPAPAGYPALWRRLAQLGVAVCAQTTDPRLTDLPRILPLVCQGATYFSPALRQAIFAPRSATRRAPLTPRQLETVAMIARYPDASRAEIAERLHISQSTLKKHVAGAFGALGVSNMAACLLECLRRDLLPLDPAGD